MSNENIKFHLTRGNKDNFPVGMSVDKIVFGRSLGGQIFTSETLENIYVVEHQLENDSQELFDPIVPSDFIKNNINYRCIYILNSGEESFQLNEINVGDVVQDVFIGVTLTDVSIAAEAIYTLAEVSRPIPADFRRPQNPSSFLDDEYDSTEKLSALTFAKTLTLPDLPSEIPANSVLKLWIKRELVVDKTEMPENEAFESFTINVIEYDTLDTTALKIDYKKLKGRVSLSNWFDYTITSGDGSTFILKELIPKEVDVSEFNIKQIFSVDDKILLFYSQLLTGSLTTLYYLLVIEPSSISDNNKYVQVRLVFDSGLVEKEKHVSKDIIDIKKSYYDQNKFYIFWNEEVSVNDLCTLFYFGYYDRYDRISVDELFTHIWTSSIFVNLSTGWDNRRIETYNVLDHKIIRKYTTFINMQQIDDLFILFTQNTKNKALLELESVNLNRNQLLYIFEKDLDNSEQYSSFNNYPGEDAEVFSQRLLPNSIPTISQITSFNNAKNKYNSLIISESTEISRDISSTREIKYLLDGSRYVDINSIHGKEFKIGNRFVTYELPVDIEQTQSITVDTSIKIRNDTSIYNSLNDVYLTTNTMENIIDGDIVELAWFQKNIIDLSDAGSLSIPKYWIDRTYKDIWIPIISSIPESENILVPFTLEYNFYRNIWRTKTLDTNLEEVITIHNLLDGQSSDSEIGKEYSSLIRKDLQYIFELDHYQTISVNIGIRNIYSNSFNVNKFMIRYEVYFKGNTEPIIEVTTYSNDIKNISYLFINPEKEFSMDMNYFDVFNSSGIVKNYYIPNIQKILLNELDINISKELPVNPQRQIEQSEFKYYRIIDIDNIIQAGAGQEQSGELVIPLVLYGNAYVSASDSAINYNLEVKYPFDFNKLSINDKTIRIYSENNQKTPLEFKVSTYDYDRDMVVLWIKLKDFGISTNRLYLFYDKINKTDNYIDIKNSYIYLKNNLYLTAFIGAWHFDFIIDDSRTSFVNGAIFEVGDPLIYEKSFDNQLRLTKIEKEYFYGLAKVYKSNYFNIDMDLPTEDGLLFDDDKKLKFTEFIKNVASVFKPAYTEVNDVKISGIEILEAGEGGAGVATNKNLSGLIAVSANENVNTFYERLSNNTFDLKTSYNGYNKLIDWVIAKPINSSVFKSGIFKISGKVKSETIKFISPFKDTDYYMFICSPTNDKLYWNQLCEDRFTISSSHYLTREVCWMAFHKDMFGGIFTPDSLYVGKREITNGSALTSGTTGTTGTSGDPVVLEPNLNYWVDSELIIEPEVGLDPGEMSIDPTDPGYSILLSSNENINMYWTEKEMNSFNIKTSAPVNCIVHWAVIKNGIEWWNEII